MLLVIMQDNNEGLSNLGLKAFAIGTGDKKVFAEGATIGGNRTVSESFSQELRIFHRIGKLMHCCSH